MLKYIITWIRFENFNLHRLAPSPDLKCSFGSYYLLGLGTGRCPRRPSSLLMIPSTYFCIEQRYQTALTVRSIACALVLNVD